MRSIIIIIIIISCSSSCCSFEYLIKSGLLFFLCMYVCMYGECSLILEGIYQVVDQRDGNYGPDPV